MLLGSLTGFKHGFVRLGLGPVSLRIRPSQLAAQSSPTRGCILSLVQSVELEPGYKVQVRARQLAVSGSLYTSAIPTIGRVLMSGEILRPRRRWRCTASLGRRLTWRPGHATVRPRVAWRPAVLCIPRPMLMLIQVLPDSQLSIVRMPGGAQPGNTARIAYSYRTKG